MNDLFHYVGGDVGVSSTGDLQPIDGTIRGQQRIIRRLVTNPREVLPNGDILPPDYIFHPDYGAGLQRKIGDTADIPKIRALIRGQILLEDVVAKNPEPQIEVQAINAGLSVSIRYIDAVSKTPVALSFSVNR